MENFWFTGKQWYMIGIKTYISSSQLGQLQHPADIWKCLLTFLVVTLGSVIAISYVETGGAAKYVSATPPQIIWHQMS